MAQRNLISLEGIGSLSDSHIEAVPYSFDMTIVSNFKEEAWERIMCDIKTEEQFRRYVEYCSNIIRVFRFHHCNTGQPFGFCILQADPLIHRKVTIHGGIWKDSLQDKIGAYRCLILMAGSLMAMNYKVATQNSSSNTVATKFLQGAGFKCNRVRLGYRYYWISLKTLTASRVYRYLYE